MGEDKFSLYTNLMRCTMAPMKDLSTYVLLVLIVAFDGAPEGSVAAKLRANFQTMLARYLSQKENGRVCTSAAWSFLCLPNLFRGSNTPSSILNLTRRRTLRYFYSFFLVESEFITSTQAISTVKLYYNM